MKTLHDGSSKKDDKEKAEIIDKTKEQQTVPSKNNSMIMWAIVGLMISVAIIYLVQYIKKQNGEKN
jgi:capsular polysaccharide biosynthesis protein